VTGFGLVIVSPPVTDDDAAGVGVFIYNSLTKSQDRNCNDAAKVCAAYRYVQCTVMSVRKSVATFQSLDGDVWSVLCAGKRISQHCPVFVFFLERRRTF